MNPRTTKKVIDKPNKKTTVDELRYLSNRLLLGLYTDEAFVLSHAKGVLALGSRFKGYKAFEYASFVTAVKSSFHDDCFHPSICCVSIDCSFRDNAFAYGDNPKALRSKFRTQAFYAANSPFAFKSSFEDYAFAESKGASVFACRFTSHAFYRAHDPLAIGCEFENPAFCEAHNVVCYTSSPFEIGNPYSGIFLIDEDLAPNRPRDPPHLEVFYPERAPKQFQLVPEDVKGNWTLENTIVRLRSIVQRYEVQLPPVLQRRLYR